MRPTPFHPLAAWHSHQGARNDCGPHSVAIVVNGLRGRAVVDPDALARAMEGRRSWRLPDRVRNWATFPWGVARALREHGLRARWRVGASVGRLHRNLNAGLTTIVLVGRPLRFKGGRWRGWSHYKVLYDWDGERGWAFVDPRVADAPGISWQGEGDFLRTWGWMGRQLIEVWGE